jgi:hypothetical protein
LPRNISQRFTEAHGDLRVYSVEDGDITCTTHDITGGMDPPSGFALVGDFVVGVGLINVGTVHTPGAVELILPDELQVLGGLDGARASVLVYGYDDSASAAVPMLAKAQIPVDNIPRVYVNLLDETGLAANDFFELGSIVYLRG